MATLSVLFCLFSTSQAFSTTSLSSNLISQLAVLALQLRLKSQDDVQCHVESTSGHLLQGRVGPVTVTGKAWQSGLGLTCRALQATVTECCLDVASIVQRQKLLLTRPAQGHAMVALTADDMDQFLQHPWMQRALQEQTQDLAFVPGRVTIDKGVSMMVSHDNAMHSCTLTRGNIDGARAVFTVTHGNTGERLPAMEQRLTDFFNQVRFELDGTFLTFRDLMLTDKGSEPSVMLALGIEVHKFPSPGIEF